MFHGLLSLHCSLNEMYSDKLRQLAFFRLLSVCAALLVGTAPFSSCLAGGGPENVFLLVNSLSQDSLTVANHYVDLRKIPPSNVFYLEYRGNMATTNGRTFRDKILLPALEEIDRRKLSGQIDYLIYSCDFPWRIDFPSDFPNEKFSPQARPNASLTGATYLWAFVKKKRKEMFGKNTNFYCPSSPGVVTISRGFRSQYRWSPGGKRAGAEGLPYMLSAMLGVTYGRGNTPDEIVRYLQKSSRADGTAPSGTVYFVKNKSPRSTPRHKLFPAAARELRVAGVRVEIIEGRSLQGKQDVIGMTTGAPQLNIDKSRCRFLPGTFCDNLTSAGGQFFVPKKPPGQTCVSEFLRRGAAGACGTVIEPYAIREKFPLPTIHVHYARGCSLAEAFYQSVSGPYQQILVGDPLCMPWADRPVVTVEDLSDGAIIRGTIELVPSATTLKSSEISTYDLYIDGVRTEQCLPGETFSLDTTTLADGHHELRVVATDNTPIETQGRLIRNVFVKNGRDAVQLSVDSSSTRAGSKQLSVQVASTLQTDVVVMNNGRELGRVKNGKGTLRIGTDRLGTGPITLYCQTVEEPKLRSKSLRVVLK